MSNSAQRNPVAGNTFVALYLPLLLLAIAIPSVSAQCSQATRPKAASSAQPAVSSQSEQPIGTSNDSSWSETARSMRFATGTAITVLENTPLQVITDSPISSRTTKEGAKLPFTVTRDVVVNGILVIPCGARVYGTVVSAKQATRAVGASSLTLQLTELDLGGKTYPLYTPPFKVVGESKTRPTVNKAATGAAVGAAVVEAGAESSVTPVATGPRLASVAIGAGVGAGIGTAIGTSTPPSIALIPSESQIEFTLATPIAVFPVDQPTAARLARGMYHGGPVLYMRGENQ